MAKNANNSTNETSKAQGSSQNCFGKDKAQNSSQNNSQNSSSNNTKNDSTSNTYNN